MDLQTTWSPNWTEHQLYNMAELLSEVPLPKKKNSKARCRHLVNYLRHAHSNYDKIPDDSKESAFVFLMEKMKTDYQFLEEEVNRQLFCRQSNATQISKINYIRRNRNKYAKSFKGLKEGTYYSLKTPAGSISCKIVSLLTNSIEVQFITKQNLYRTLQIPR